MGNSDVTYQVLPFHRCQGVGHWMDGGGIYFLWGNITGPKPLRRTLQTCWALPNDPCPLPENLTLLSPLHAYSGQASNLTLPLPELAKMSGLTPLTPALSKPQQGH